MALQSLPFSSFHRRLAVWLARFDFGEAASLLAWSPLYNPGSEKSLHGAAAFRALQ